MAPLERDGALKARFQPMERDRGIAGGRGEGVRTREAPIEARDREWRFGSEACGGSSRLRCPVRRSLTPWMSDSTSSRTRGLVAGLDAWSAIPRITHQGQADRDGSERPTTTDFDRARTPIAGPLTGSGWDVDGVLDRAWVALESLGWTRFQPCLTVGVLGGPIFHRRRGLSFRPALTASGGADERVLSSLEQQS